MSSTLGLVFLFECFVCMLHSWVVAQTVPHGHGTPHHLDGGRLGLGQSPHVRSSLPHNFRMRLRPGRCVGVVAPKVTFADHRFGQAQLQNLVKQCSQIINKLTCQKLPPICNYNDT